MVFLSSGEVFPLMKRFSFAAFLFAAVILFPPALHAQHAQTNDLEAIQQEAKNSTVNIGDTLTEKVMGDPAAPVSVIEYASLTCGHCAFFHTKILPEVVK